MKVFKVSTLIYVIIALVIILVAMSGGKPGPAKALRMLQEGNNRFVAGKLEHPHSDSARLKLAGKEDQGDHAYATVLTCSDSRVPAEYIFDAGVMDLFVVRVAGNVVNPDEAGALEYGLSHVHTPVLVVLGHTQCGAVKAVAKAMQGHGGKIERNIPPLITSIEPAVEQALHDHPELAGKPELLPYAEVDNVWQAIRNLFMLSPSTRELVEDGDVKVVGAIYDVSTGKVRWLSQDKVEDILAQVNKDPDRYIDPMALSDSY